MGVYGFGYIGIMRNSVLGVLCIQMIGRHLPFGRRRPIGLGTSPVICGDASLRAGDDRIS